MATWSVQTMVPKPWSNTRAWKPALLRAPQATSASMRVENLETTPSPMGSG